MTQQTILVAGASGQLGKGVLEHLLANGVPNIIATTRTPEKLESFATRGVNIRAADFNDPEALLSAFAGADRLLLISTDDLFSGRRVQQHTNAINAAKQAGVKHILYTSMPDPEGSKEIFFAPDHIATEEALRESGLSHTILRVAWYAENPVDLGLIRAALRTGSWFTAAGSGRIAYVTRTDVARTVAAVLAGGDVESRIYDITGPQSLAPDELAASLSRVVGQKIVVRQVSKEDLKRTLVEAGVPEQLAPMLASTDANTSAGRFDLVTTAVQDLTGTAPADFEHFLLSIRAELDPAA